MSNYYCSECNSQLNIVEDDYGCSCHINAPCWTCLNMTGYCCNEDCSKFEIDIDVNPSQVYYGALGLIPSLTERGRLLQRHARLKLNN